MRLCNELEGLLRGIQADGVILPEETARIVDWLGANRQFTAIHPFSELARKLEAAIDDGHLTTDEVEDLLFVACKFTTVNPYFDQMRAGIQVLMGLLSGYAADAVITPAEAQHLLQWADDWQHLRGLWPFDECESIVTWMIARGRITEDAAHLLEMSTWLPIGGAPPTDPPALTLAGVCTSNPDITFADRQFVFTGESAKCPRSEMEGHVLRREGRAHPNVTLKTDYLIVCDEGNPHWAFCCYGRKVEKAYQLRREGHRVSIVHESDFWDALN